MKQISPYLLLLVLSFMASCGNKLPPKEYVNYILNPDNGLYVSSDMNGVKYTLQYQPVEYLVMLQLKSFSIPPDTFKEEYNRFKGMEHYVFHIDINDMKTLLSKETDSSLTKNNLLDYLNFKIQKDIKLVEGSDTIPCGISECESGMGMFPYYSFVIGFPMNEYQGDREFIFSSKKIRTGDVKLVIKGQSIKNLPKLKMNG
jgi:hypothetical protein